MPPKDWKGIQLGYVNHSQAEKLKAIGFDCYCKATWICLGRDEWRFEEQEIDELNIVGQKFLAPTVDHALKWLRRVHKIYIGSTRCEGYSWLDVVDDNTGSRLSFTEIRFLDREDADMHGLDVSIRYLENGSPKSLTANENNSNNIYKSLNA